MVTKITSLFRKRKRCGDGETLAFVAGALKRVIADEYRTEVLGQAPEIESRLDEVDRVLTAGDGYSAMEPLAEKINAVHVSLANLLSTLADSVPCIDSESGSSRTGNGSIRASPVLEQRVRSRPVR